MSTTDEREAYQGDEQDFRHKQSLRTDAATTHNVASVKTARTASGVAIKRCPTCGQMLRGARMQDGPRMVHPPGKGAVCRRIRAARSAK